MTINKIQDCAYFSYQEGLLGYLYYPDSGMVRCSNAHSTYRAIEHMARRQWEIDWARSNIGRNILYVKIPDHLTEEESLELLGKTKEELYDQESHDKEVARQKLILNNIDNTTGEVITEKYLKSMMNTLSSRPNKDRQFVADWFGKYNIEVVRPEHPIINVSTKPKKTIIAEGRRLIWELFEKGLLRRLTKEEYADKLKKYAK